VMREVIATHIEDVQAAVAVAPQTNEVGRSAALLAGLFDLVAASGVRRIRLLELGAHSRRNNSRECRCPAALGEVGLEFDPYGPRGAEPELRTRLWSPAASAAPRQHLIGTAHHHGVPVRLVAS
jgi:hypothetical protein